MLTLTGIAACLTLGSCTSQSDCARYLEFTDALADEWCAELDDSCWPCRCWKLGEELIVSYQSDPDGLNVRATGHQCVPFPASLCRPEPPWDSGAAPCHACLTSEEWIAECFADEARCRSILSGGFDGICALHAVVPCTTAADCTWTSERCIDGLCQGRTCECPPFESECAAQTCDLPGEVCSLDWCYTPGDPLH
ncbi:MAG TPA: hypothetical protein PK668_08645 [Myxococcota bacterium]|nr:hypothetical protein [Myxococcota bacterium]HRY92954.1 hypothetical protein [Myxococcota bacterium]HSA24685.1 hypothetical protein [Myxococcota bacterium]